MVSITKQNSNFIFEVKGLHKLWSFRSQLEVPSENVLKAYQDPAKLNKWKGLRFPGTYAPYLITAGTYYLDGSKNFWDVVNEKNCIIVDLKDEEFNSLIIEVEDPQAAIRLLSEK